MAKHLQVWENYQKFADERGWLVVMILKQFTSLEGKKVLDLGCGVGGASRKLFEAGAEVIAVDIRPELEPVFKNTGVIFINAKDENSYFKSQNYDIVILQDLLEHVHDPVEMLEKVKYSLRPGGLIFISTPNRFSLLNAISDPHWNLPGVALFPRQIVAFLVSKVFRRDLRQRVDWAALLSFKKLNKILALHNFKLIFVNTLVAKILFQSPHSVICHPAQIQLVNWVRCHRLDRLVIRLVNDHKGIFNSLINPTWYLIGIAR